MSYCCFFISLAYVLKKPKTKSFIFSLIVLIKEKVGKEESVHYEQRLILPYYETSQRVNISLRGFNLIISVTWNNYSLKKYMSKLSSKIYLIKEILTGDHRTQRIFTDDHE